MLSIKLAWRNIWRNPKRSRITVAAVSINTGILIMTFALMEGMKVGLVHNVTHIMTGDAQLHAPGFRDDRSIYKSIPKAAQFLAHAKRAGVNATMRSFGGGLVSIGNKSAGANFIGIDPRAEALHFEFPKRLGQGTFLSEATPNHALLGANLARNLQAKLGDEMIVVVQAADGSMGNEIFLVEGILSSVDAQIDQAGVFIHRRDFESLFVCPGRIHEIALRDTLGRAPQELVKVLEPHAQKQELLDWQSLMPALHKMIETNDASMGLMILILGLGAAMGVMNTMLMATHDRVREYGVQRALGTPAGQILRDIILEASLIAVLASVFGCLIGIPITLYLQNHGIDLGTGETGLNFAGINMMSIWKAHLTSAHVVTSCIVALTMSVLASIYPGLKVCRISPIEAINHV
jgi:ABC-type lipoprotein release transport system permease subunit